MMTVRVRLKKARKPNQPRFRFDLEKLRDPNVARTFQATIDEKFSSFIGLEDGDTDMVKDLTSEKQRGPQLSRTGLGNVLLKNGWETA